MESTVGDGRGFSSLAEDLLELRAHAPRFLPIKPPTHAARLRLQRLAPLGDAVEQLGHCVVAARGVSAFGGVQYLLVQQGKVVIVPEMLLQTP
jgi:hypothetical protein